MSITTVHRHPRFALSLIVGLLITALLFIAPRPGAAAFEPLHYLWRCTCCHSLCISANDLPTQATGNGVYIDKGYNPGVSMWGDLYRTLEYSEGVYQDIIRERNKHIRVLGGEGIAAFPDPGTHLYTICTYTILFLFGMNSC
jgi:hypothetical protein